MKTKNTKERTDRVAKAHFIFTENVNLPKIPEFPDTIKKSGDR